jgi:hypothetical protein
MVGSLKAATLTDGLLLWYGFNGSMVDLSGNGNYGVIQTGANYGADRFGNPNSALIFNSRMGTPLHHKISE